MLLDVPSETGKYLCKTYNAVKVKIEMIGNKLNICIGN